MQSQFQGAASVFDEEEGEAEGEEHQGDCLYKGRRSSTSPPQPPGSRPRPRPPWVWMDWPRALLLLLWWLRILLLLPVPGTYGSTLPMPHTITGSRSGRDIPRRLRMLLLLPILLILLLLLLLPLL